MRWNRLVLIIVLLLPCTGLFGATGSFDPQQWGARPNDDQDDTAAIQAAIDAARDHGGGEVVIPAGTFKVSKTLYLWGVEKWDNHPKDRRLGTRGITLRGLSRRASIIHYTGDGVCLWLFTAAKDGAQYFHTGAAVRSLHLLGSDKSGTTGLMVSDLRTRGSTGGSTLVENNAIEKFDVGLHVEHSYGARFAYNKLRYNGTAVRVGSPEGSTYNINGNSFRDNEFSHSRGVGVRIYGGDHNLFEGGLIEGNGEEGIHIERGKGSDAGYLTFRNIWIENNQRGKEAADLGQVFVHSTEGTVYNAARPVVFDRCHFNSQGDNYHLRIGNTIGLQLIYNQFSHPNHRIIYRMPDTYCAWAVVHTINEDQNSVIRGVLAPSSGAAGDPDRDDVRGTRFMPHVYFPANSAKTMLTAEIEADARTHSSIASAAGTFTTQHVLTGDKTLPLVLPAGSALIGMSIYCTGQVKADTIVRLMFDDKGTSLQAVLSAGADATYRQFELAEYKAAADFIGDKAKRVSFRTVGDLPADAKLHVVAFWRSNQLPVF